MDYLRSHHKLAYDLILHGREQKKKGGDFSKRIAFLCFDNSIELSITVYFSYYGTCSCHSKRPNKMQFHEKIDCLEEFITKKSLSSPFIMADLLNYHETRNKIYHEGISILPRDIDLDNIDNAAEWIFKYIFDFDYSEPFEDWGTSSFGIVDRAVSVDIEPNIDIIQNPKSKEIDVDTRRIILTLTNGNGDYVIEDVISLTDPIISVTDGSNNAIKLQIKKETSQHIELIGYFKERVEQEIEFTFSLEVEYLGKKSKKSFKKTIKHIP